MRDGRSFRIIVAVLLLGGTGAVAVTGITRVTTAVNNDLRDQNNAIRDIAAAAAAALDRGGMDRLPRIIRSLLVRHPKVLAVEVAPDQGPPLVRLGAVGALDAKLASNSSEVHRVTLIRGDRPWGTVRFLFRMGIRASVFHPGHPAFWVISGLAVLVLPLTVAVLDAVRRRLDRSPSGPMAVAAARARHTLDTLAEGVLLLDSRLRIVFANEAFQAKLEAGAPRLIGAPVGDLSWSAPPDSARTDLLPWESAVMAGAPVRGVRLGLRSSAGTVVFNVNCTPIFRRRRSLHAVLVTFDDVTELEQGRLALREARDAAQHANEAKSRFLAMMSHEIRTPLNGVCGSLQLLKQTPLKDRQPQYVEAARFSASTLLHLINDILDFSKIEAGQLELSPVEFNLERCIDDTMLMMVQNARAKGLVIAYEIEAGVAPAFVADPDRLRQVIINLTNNAIKFTERGSVTLRVGVERDGSDHQLLRCALADTGIGIPEAKMDRLFKAFSQVDSSTSRRYGGTGLGLIISKQLCELMGGRIDVSSIEGKGTTFSFFVDLRKGPERTPVQSPAPDDGAWAVLIGLHEMEVRVARRALGLADRRVLVCAHPGEVAESFRAASSLCAAGPGTIVIAGSSVSEVTAIARHIRQCLPGIVLRFVAAAFEAGPAGTPGSDIDRWLLRPIGARRLRAAVGPAGSPDDHDTAATGASDEAPDLSGLRILLAEDNAVGQMVVSDMLRGAGANCDAVGDGNAAVAAVESRPYDVVLMDCFMPELDGFEATRRIRELQQQGKLQGHVPVIALTAKAMRGDREACLRAGMDGYVSKPVDQGELLKAVAKHAGRTNGRTTVPKPAPPEHSTNLEVLLERFGSKPDLLAKLVQTFRETSTQDLARIEGALRDLDAHVLEHAAHRLAGGAGFVCADAVRRLASDLERRAVDRQLDGLESKAQELRRELEASMKDLEHVLTAPDKTSDMSRPKERSSSNDAPSEHPAH